MYCINRLVFDIGMRVEFEAIIARDEIVPRNAHLAGLGGRAKHPTFVGACAEGSTAVAGHIPRTN